MSELDDKLVLKKKKNSRLEPVLLILEKIISYKF